MSNVSFVHTALRNRLTLQPYGYMPHFRYFRATLLSALTLVVSKLVESCFSHKRRSSVVSTALAISSRSRPSSSSSRQGQRSAPLHSTSSKAQPVSDESATLISTVQKALEIRRLSMAPATTSSSADQSSASASSVPLQNPTIFSDRRWVWTGKPARPPHNRWLSCPCQPSLPIESSGLSSRIWTSFFLRICVNSPKSKYACRLVSTRTHLRSAGEPCPCGEKFGPRPIFKIFSLDQIRVDQEKKEVRKRRALELQKLAIRCC